MRRQIPASAPKSTGKAALAKHLGGVRLTQRQAILAKCCDCMGYWVDGRVDCRVRACPLYGFMPYRQKSILASAGATTPPSEPDKSPRTVPGRVAT